MIGTAHVKVDWSDGTHSVFIQCDVQSLHHSAYNQNVSSADEFQGPDKDDHPREDLQALWVIQENKINRASTVRALSSFEVFLLAVEYLKPTITRQIQITYSSASNNFWLMNGGHVTVGDLYGGGVMTTADGAGADI